MFSRQTLESVQQLPLYDVASTHVRLSRVGSNWRGLSPFSQEKTPSFYVRTDVNLFKDFSSGLSGDGIKFIMEIEKLTFPEAVETLAERFHIPIEYDKADPRQAQRRSLKKELLDIHEYACDYFHRAFLADEDESRGMREYWTAGRHFSLEEAKEWKIGFAPGRDRGLLTFLRKKGFSTEALKECGLFYVPKRSPLQVDRYSPRFRGRLMIPIHNIQNQVIAFTARQTDWTPEDDIAKEAKYVNSPETPIFVKGRMLFNLNRAYQAVRESERFLLVEGQLDALRCTSVGLGHAVAPQGSSVTEEQLSMLHRHSPYLDLLLDGDSAGIKAALRLLPIAFRTGMDVRCLPLPEKEDPDDFFRKHGKEGLALLESQAIRAMDFAAQTLLPAKAGAIERENVLNTLFGFLENIDSPVRQSELLEEAITATGVQADAARVAFRRHIGTFQRSRQRGRELAAQREERPAEITSNETLTSPESEILWAVLKDIDWSHRLLQVINLEWISTSTQEGKALAHILNEISAGNWEDLASCLGELDDPDLRDCLHAHIVDEKDVQDPHAFLTSSLNALKRCHLRRRSEALTAKLDSLHGEPEAFRDVLESFQSAQKQLIQFEPVVLPA